jgi:hypothetical protein
MKKTLIIGCVSHYNTQNIHNWIQSINKSGFSGDRILIVYEVQDDLIAYAQKNGFTVFKSRLERHIVVDRFRDIYQVINNTDYKYVISTDVKDVIFQYDPTLWLEKNLGDESKVIVSSECLMYRDENWGKNNMHQSFPGYAETMMDKEIYNAGTIAGEFKAFTEFVKKVYELSITSFCIQPDQAALNILTHILSPDMVRKTSQSEAWCGQLGTVMDERVVSVSGDKLLEKKPIWNSERKKLETEDGVEFALVHQYDRIPHLNNQINDLYK